MRLGTELIRKGLIDKAQLKEALDAQLIFGGHLGTCLIELGYIDEQTLGLALAETFGAPYATPEVFLNVPRSVTAAISASVAEKHRAIPFKREDKLLSVAMIDPKNLAGIDEIGFAAGVRIQPWIAPEARILQALERYYDLARPLRYVTLCRQLDHGSEDPDVPGAGAFVDYRSFTNTPERAESPVPKESRAPRPKKEVQASRVEEDQRKERVSANEDPLQDFSRQICLTDSHEDLANAALNQFSRGLKRSVLFMVKSGRAILWRARGVSLSKEECSTLSIPVTSEPMFGLLGGEDHYRGAVANDSRLEPFFRLLKITPPAELLLMPVHMNDRLVAICYGDGAQGRIEGRTEDYRRFAQMLGLGINLVSVKRRIRSL